MSFARKTLTPLLILLMLLTACGSGLATSTPVDANSVSTSLVGTLVASLFQTQTAAAPSIPTSTPLLPTPINTVAYPTIIYPTSTAIYYYPTLGTKTPAFTPTVTGTKFTPTVNPGYLAYGCNNLAFVRDVSIPSGTELTPNEDFTKTWKVANTGTCKWEYHYQIKLLSGNPFGGKTTMLNRVVTVGDWSEISVQMGAPRDPGTYTNYWRMADQDGHMFGATLVVSFTVVANPTKTSSPPTKTSAPPTATYTPSSTPEPTDTPVPTDTP